MPSTPLSRQYHFGQGFVERCDAYQLDAEFDGSHLFQSARGYVGLEEDRNGDQDGVSDAFACPQNGAFAG